MINDSRSASMDLPCANAYNFANNAHLGRNVRWPWGVFSRTAPVKRAQCEYQSTPGSTEKPGSCYGRH